MRVEKIKIPDAGLYLDPASGAYIGRNQHLANVIRAMRQPCIEGYATLYGKLHRAACGYQVLMPKCFARSLASGREVKFLFEHDANNVIGSTKSGLTLADSDEGLAFRMLLRHANAGLIASQLVATGSKDNASIGFVVQKDVWRTIEGQQVRFVIEAELVECSLVKAGAVAHAFASVADAATVEAPTSGAKSSHFQMMKSFHRLGVALRGLQQAWDSPPDKCSLDGLLNALRELNSKLARGATCIAA